MDGIPVRRAGRNDIESLLALYTELAEGRNVAAPVPAAKSRPILDAIMADPMRHLLVATVGAEVAGSVDLIIVPNLTNHGRPWAIIENVIVAQAHRRSGIGKALMRCAIDEARLADCYKVQLLSGKEKQRTAANTFYRSLGFNEVAKGFKIHFHGTDS
jgi:predicted N-acetyltransferase YhbS